MEVLTEFGRRLGASGTFDTLNLPYCAPRDKRFCVDDDEISKCGRLSNAWFNVDAEIRVMTT